MLATQNDGRLSEITVSPPISQADTHVARHDEATASWWMVTFHSSINFSQSRTGTCNGCNEKLQGPNATATIGETASWWRGL
jgi:hypothetical protein